MAGSIGGYVVRARSTEPLEGAEVFILEGVGPVPEAGYLVTDSAGWFSLQGLSPGDWSLGARGPDGGKGEATVHVFDNALSEVTIEVADVPQTQRRSPAGRTRRSRSGHGRGGARLVGSIRGRVIRGGTGKPVVDATITIVRGAGPAPDIGPVTDRSGRFVLDGLVEGEWLLKALAPDGSIGTGTAHVSVGHAAEVLIEV